jgi:transcriptional regulator GlxA family with amidase domain
MAELVDHEVEPSRVFPSFGADLVAGIRNGRDTAERTAIAECVLQNALSETSKKDELIRRIHKVAGGGEMKGREIAESLGVSDRTFRRLWRDLVGIEHRKFFSLMRIHRALTMIDAGNELSAVAVECGFSDQPHLARDVKRLCGLSATLLRKRLGADVYQDLYVNRPSAPWTRN